jgi:hypothetical protein
MQLLTNIITVLPLRINSKSLPGDKRITNSCNHRILWCFVTQDTFVFADVLKQRWRETQILIPHCDRRSRRSFGELDSPSYQHRVSKNTKIITQDIVFSGGHAHITIKTSSPTQAVTLLACIQGADRPSWMTGSVNFLFSPSLPITFHVISNSSLT